MTRVQQRLAQLHRAEFERFMSRVFAPYARFQRNGDGYQSHSVQVAWRVWGAASYSPYRPDLDQVGQQLRDKELKRGRGK